ncbi:MAG: hypothetical protein LBJ70_05720 [Holosporales bacterium]|jgi:hypothetical protein|nr:hypothetical protein [Holosporales bacterium]
MLGNYRGQESDLQLLDSTFKIFLDDRLSRTPPFLMEVPDLTAGTTSNLETFLPCYAFLLQFSRSVLGETTSGVNDRGPMRVHTARTVTKDNQYTALLYGKHTSADTIPTITVNTMTNLKAGVQIERSVLLTNCQITGILSNGILALYDIYYDRIDFGYPARDRTGADTGQVATGFDYRTWSASGE